MKRYSKQNCKYAFAVTKYVKLEECKNTMSDSDFDKYHRFVAIENKWREGQASNSPVTNEGWGLFS